MIDIATLAQSVTTFLIPALPYLLSLSGTAAEEASKKLGEDIWEGAKSIWHKLLPKVEAKPGAIEATQKVVESPTDEDYKTVLRVHLKEILASDKKVADEINQILETPDAGGVTLNLKGSRLLAAGGNIKNNIIVFGDNTQDLGAQRKGKGRQSKKKNL